MLLLVPQTSRSSRHGRYYVATGSWERMKNMLSPCFLHVAQAGEGRLYVQAAEEFIVVPDVFVANVAEIGDGRR